MRNYSRVLLLSFSGLCLIAIGVVLIIAHRSLAAPDPAAVKVQGADTAGTPVNVAIVSGGTSTPTSNLNASTFSTNGTGGTISLAGAVGKTTFLTAMYCKFTNTTSISPQHVTITGLAGGGTLDLVVDAESDLGTPVMISFPSPLAASAQNTAITMTLPSPGGTIVIAAWLTGYQQ